MNWETNSLSGPSPATKQRRRSGWERTGLTRKCIASWKKGPRSASLSSGVFLLRTRWNKTTKRLIMSVLFSRLTHHDHTPWCFLVFLCHSFNVVKHNTNKMMIRLVKVIATLRVFEHTFWDGCKFLWEIQEITRLMTLSCHTVKIHLYASSFCRAKHYDVWLSLSKTCFQPKTIETRQALNRSKKFIVIVHFNQRNLHWKMSFVKGEVC